MPNLFIHSDLIKQGIQEIVAVGVSDFTGSSSARKHNIALSLDKFQGYLIKPNQEFSFNDILGEVDGTTGYKKELVIKGDRTIKEWGGGICQVSSTLYRSIMLSGLPITERFNHSYSVQYYYPYGSDATIYPGVRDFKFLNNTNNSLLLHTSMKENQAVFVILGTKVKNDINIFGPYISNVKYPPKTKFLPSTTLADGKKVLISDAHKGFTSTWFRSVNGSLELYRSNYQARPQIYKVGGLKEEKIGHL